MKFRQIFNDFHPLTKLVFDILLIIILAFFFFFLGTFILGFIHGLSFQEVIKISSDINGDISIIKQSQLIYSLSLFVFPTLIIAYFFDKNPLNFYQLNKSAASINYINVIFLIIISLPIVNYLATFNANIHLPSYLSSIENIMSEMENSAKVLTEKLLAVNSISQLLLNIFIIALVPAIGEELFFRGLIQKHLSEWFKNVHFSIFVTAFIFSAFHFQFFTFIPRLFLGIVLGYLFVWSKSLWLNITAHFTNNAIAVIAYFYMFKNGMSVDKMDSFGADTKTVMFALYSTILFFVILFFIYKNEKNRQVIK